MTEKENAVFLQLLEKALKDPGEVWLSTIPKVTELSRELMDAILSI